MIKLAGQIIDSYDDPKFVSDSSAQARFPSPAEISALKDRDFAVIIKTAARTHRKYPISTPDLVKVSSAYYNEYSHILDKDMRDAARTRIQQAAQEFNIKLAGAVAEPADATTFVFNPVSQPKEDVVGITKQAAFDIAVDRFLGQYSRMTPLERALAADELNKLGELNDTRVLDYVPKSEYGPHFANGIRQRMHLVQEDNVKLAQLKNLTKDIVHRDARAGAILLDRFDKTAEIEGRVQDAYLTCWSGFVKKAARDFLSEEERHIETLAKVHADAVKNVFDEMTAHAFLRDPVGFYRAATGPVKTALTSLVKSVNKPNVSATVDTKAVNMVKQEMGHGNSSQHK